MLRALVKALLSRGNRNALYGLVVDVVKTDKIKTVSLIVFI